MADLAPGVVTLFGGSGFIGSQAVRALARRGWRIRVAVRNPVLAIEVQPLGDPGQIQFMRCDVTNPDDVARALRGSDALVNLVGVLHDGGKRRGFQAVHVEAARTIAQAARAAGCAAWSRSRPSAPTWTAPRPTPGPRPRRNRKSAPFIRTR